MSDLKQKEQELRSHLRKVPTTATDQHLLEMVVLLLDMIKILEQEIRSLKYMD